MNDFLLLILCSATVYRCGRFIVLDDLIEDTRNTVLNWITTGEGYEGEGDKRPILKASEPGLWHNLPLWRRKLHDLLTCPFCVTVWIAGAVTLLTHFIVQPLPAPVWWWLAISALSLVFWAIVDSED